MSEATKKCKHCQTEIPKKAKICPNCKKKQGSVLKTFGIVILVILVLSAIGGSSDSDNEKTTQQSTTSETVKVEDNKVEEVKKEEPKVEETVVEITYTEVTVSEMMNTLESNALKAEKTYQDQYLEVTGRLGIIDSDGDYITLYPSDNEWAFTGVQCYIKNDDQLNKVLEMSVDDTVTLKGKVTTVGEVLGYGLDIDEIQ